MEHRREIKFLLSGADPGKLIDVIGGNARPVRFGRYETSRVHSIYFDDASLVSARESLAGVGRRAKLRLRWYDEPLASSRAFFEVKSRSGTSMAKQRFPIDLDRPLGAMRYTELLRLLAQSLPKDVEALLAVRCNPTVLVTYQRRHFVDHVSKIRITVDWDVRGFDQAGEARPVAIFDAPWPDAVIIEVKTPIDAEIDASRLIYPLRARVSRSSKYVQICSRMGWYSVDEALD